MVVQSFGVWIVRICCILCELCMMEKKKEEEEEEEEEGEEWRRRTKLKFSCLIFSTMRRSNGTLRLYFT